MLAADPIGLQLVVFIVANALCFGPAQDIDDVACTKTLVCLAHAPEKAARIDGTILQHQIFTLTVIAIGTIRIGIDLAKVAKQRAAAAIVSFAIAQHLLELLTRNPLLFLAGFLVDHKLDFNAITIVQEERTLSGLTIAPGAPGLLVVTLQVAWQIEMDYCAHIRLGDTHTKGHSRYQNRHIIADKAPLVCSALFSTQSSVIRQRTNAIVHQRGAQ